MASLGVKVGQERRHAGLKETGKVHQARLGGDGGKNRVKGEKDKKTRGRAEQHQLSPFREGSEKKELRTARPVKKKARQNKKITARDKGKKC